MASGDQVEPAWKTVLDVLRQEVKNIPLDPCGFPAVTPQTVAVFQEQAKKLRDNDARLLVFGQLDVNKMIAVCRAGGCPWWTVFTARAFFGDVDGLRKVHVAYTEDAGKSETPNMSSALTWVSFPNSLANVEKNTVTVPVLEQLMAWGADPNYDDGKWLGKVAQSLSAQHIAVFLNNGGQLAPVCAELASAYRNKHENIIKNIEGALASRMFFSKTGDDEVVQTRFLPDTLGLSSLKTVFNFSSRRVTEIYTPAQSGQATMMQVSFADMETGALEQAAEKLGALGGRKDALSATLEKPPLAKRPGLSPTQNGM